MIGDQLRLKQVLINLVKNALKFTKYGTVKILVSYDQVSEMLKVIVIDSGKGIEKDEMQHLFKMFGKLRRTAEINNEGIGMGLMICKKLVELNHGFIEVFSEGKDMGSAFSFAMKMSLPPAECTYGSYSLTEGESELSSTNLTTP